MNQAAQSVEHIGPVEARAILAGVAADPSIVNVTRAAQRLSRLQPALKRVSLRVGCLSSFTFDPLSPALQLQALQAGLAIDPYIAPFGQFEQELIDPTSGLASFHPQVVILATRLQDVCPAIYDRFNALNESQARQLVEDWLGRLGSALRAFRARCPAHILIQNYDLPALPALGIADRTATPSQKAVVERANDALTSLAASLENAHVMDYDALVARHGRLNWTDPRVALYARIPIAADHYWHLAGFYVRHIRPLYGLSKKVLVMDADNTLWGGVVGDIGIEGIALGHDYPGNAYRAFQERVLDLHNRGVVLGIASKNEPGSVEEVLEKHPEMVLRAEHFAAMRINWEPKPDNLRAMAADLNLGLDSFVFMDDNPVECELMRTTLPEVQTVQLPEEPAYFARVIESLDCFDQWTVSTEDRRRGKLYKAEADRRSLQESVTDLPTFYRQLGMKMTLSIDRRGHVARAAQMTNRTNQFNMQTTRCTEDDIRRFMAADDYHVITLALKDRLGDNGVVGLAVARRERDRWILDLFLMSCRVLGRTVEQAFVGWIAQRARAAGAKSLVGLFTPTRKNNPFAGFYKGCGFVEAEPDGETQRWVLELDGAETATADYIEIEVTEPENA